MTEIEGLIDRVRKIFTREEARGILEDAQGLQDASNESFTNFVIACMKNCYPELLYAAASVIHKITWTESEKCHLLILDQISREPNPEYFDRSVMKAFAALAQSFHKTLYAWPFSGVIPGETGSDFRSRVSPSQYFTSKFVQLFIHPFSPKYSEYYATVCSQLVDCVDWRVMTDSENQSLLKVHAFLTQIADVGIKEQLGQTLHQFLHSHMDMHFYESEDKKTYFKHLLNIIWRQYVDGILLDDTHDTCLSIMATLAQEVSRDGQLADENDRATFFGNNVWYTLDFFHKNLGNHSGTQQLRRFVPLCWNWRGRSDQNMSRPEKSLKAQAERCLRRAMQQNPTVLGDLFNVICDRYFTDGLPDLAMLSSIQIAYLNAKDQPHIRSAIEQLLPRFLRAAQITPRSIEKVIIAKLIREISTWNPSVLRIYVTAIEQFIDDPETCSIGLSILKTMGTYLRGNGHGYFIRVRTTFANNSHQYLVIDTLKEIGKYSQDECDGIIHEIRTEMERQSIEDGKIDDLFLQAAATCFSELVTKYRSPFDKHREFLIALKDQYPLISLPIRSVIDYLDGRLATDEERGAKKATLDGLNSRTYSFDQESVQSEELESTLRFVTRPPGWSRDVCVLLNKRVPNDWKAVAKKLAYSSNEIRMWSGQLNPSSWLLNDFYAVTKSSEATRQLVRVLGEIRRQDVIDVIDDYQGSLGDDPVGQSSQATIFISHHLGQEYKAKSLKRRLENEGYACLPSELGIRRGPNQKIGDMIRSSAAMVAFVTEQYCRSPECIYQANYATAVDKPIIALTLERQLPWPPPGDLSNVLDTKSVVTFYERTGEHWPPSDKYNQLLTKLATVARPPRGRKPVDYMDYAVTVQPFGAMPSNSGGLLNPKQRRITFAQICLSCSPDKKYSMESLKRSLESRGYSCGICSFALDGMDECGAEVVLCALSSRYGLSSSAEKTIEQAERHERIIVPLLMENIPYPPNGFMQPVFSLLAPVDCRDMLTHLNWEGERQLAELLARLKMYLPEVQSSSFHRNDIRLPPGRRSLWRQRPTSPPPVVSSDSLGYEYGSSGRSGLPSWDDPAHPRQGHGHDLDEDEEEFEGDDESGEDNDEDEYDRGRHGEEYEEEEYSDEEEEGEDEVSSEEDQSPSVGRTKLPSIADFTTRQYYPSNLHRSHSFDDFGHSHPRDFRLQSQPNLAPAIATQRRNLSPAIDGKHGRAIDDFDPYGDQGGVKLPSLYRQKLRNT